MDKILAATLLCLVASTAEGFLWRPQPTRSQYNYNPQSYHYNNHPQPNNYNNHYPSHESQSYYANNNYNNYAVPTGAATLTAPTPQSVVQPAHNPQYNHQVVNAPANGYQYPDPTEVAMVVEPTPVYEHGMNQKSDGIAELVTDPIPIDEGNFGPQYQYPDSSVDNYMQGGSSYQELNLKAPSYCSRFVQGRIYCGYDGVQKRECEEMSCCWDPRPGQYSCFYHEDMQKMVEPVASPTEAVFVPPVPSPANNAPYMPDASQSSNYYGPVVPPTSQGFLVQEPSDSKVSFNGGCLFHCTSVPREYRKNCVPTNDKNICTSIGCCFDESETDPKKRCFHANAVKDQCPAQKECQLPYGPKEDCGYPGISRMDCEAQGCCYNSISYRSTCYRKQYGNVRPKVAITPTEPPKANKPKRPDYILNKLKKREPDYILNKLKKLEKEWKPNGNTANEEAGSPGSPKAQFPDVQTTHVVPKAAAAFLSGNSGNAGSVPTPAPAPQYKQQCGIFGCRLVPVTGQTGGQCFPKKCGDPVYTPDKIKSDFDPRKIVGGSRAFPFSHPWTVMIQKVEGNRTFICGATLICQQWLLTAAHCLDQQSSYKSTPDLNPNMYKIFIGRWAGWQSKQVGRQVQVFKGYSDIERLIQHENFVVGKHRGVITHDIALIKLRKAVKLNDYVQPACLPTESAPPKEIMFATGWGISKNKGPKPTTLKQVGVQIKDKNSCRNRVPGFNNPPGVICGGGEQDHDTCTGDSGGPLVGSKEVKTNLGTTSKRLWYLYGLTSIGSPSCNTQQFDRQPALYTDVFYYLNWIKQKTSNCCA